MTGESTGCQLLPLGQVVDFLDNMRKPVKESERTHGPYPYYGANGIQGHIDQYLFDEPLILLAEDGGHFGSTTKPIAYRVDGKYWVNNHAHVLRPKPFMDIGYLHRILAFYRITPFISGSTRGKLTKGSASRIPILVPPLPEQKRIAAILDKADEIRRKREKAIELTDSFLRSVFWEMFGDPKFNQKAFRVIKFEQVVSRMFKGAFDLKAESYQQTGMPFVRISNIWNGTIDLSEAVYISEEVAHTYDKASVEPGDLVFSKVGTIDRIAIVPDSIPKCIISQNNVGAKLRTDIIHPKYALAYLLHPHTLALIRRGSKKSVQDKLVLAELKELPVLLPDMSAQERWASIVEKVSALQKRFACSMDTHIRLHESLAGKLLAGKGVQSPPTKVFEVAHAL